MTVKLRLYTFIAGICLCCAAGVVLAQQGPVAAMFASDQKRDAALALSFHTLDVQPTKTAAFPLRVYLSAGDLERAFDQSEFRPDAAIVPTNTDLLIAASQPGTQRVLVDRVRKQPETLRGLEDQIAARRKQPPAAAGKESGLLRIGIDMLVANLSGAGAFPERFAWLPATTPTAGRLTIESCSRRTASARELPRVSPRWTQRARNPSFCRSSAPPVLRSRQTTRFMKVSACYRSAV